MVTTISSIYADFISGTRFESLSADTVQQTKKVLLDLIGVSLAGYRSMAFPRTVVDYVLDLGGKPEATVIHAKKQIPAVHAAFANASCAHALDMDDGHRFAASHPGTVIIPAAIAAAELARASTKKLIAGIVLGYEIMIRVGRAINPSSLNRGFHITGITGPFGAAGAAAKIMGLNRERTVAALGIAGLQSSGLIQVNHEEEGSMVKPINPARASMSGLLSCVLARKGARGPLQIFEGEDGYLKAFTDGAQRDILTRGLGREYEISNVYLKLYSACRHAHAPMDAAIEAFRKSGLDIADIDRIVVETYPAAVRLAGITHATTPSAARFSIPFSVSLVLVKGDAGADKYCEKNVKDDVIQALAGKVQLAVSEKWAKLYPHERGASVTLFGTKGKSWSAEVALAKGEPENPASWEELTSKFFTNAGQLLSKARAEELSETILHLEQSTVRKMVSLL